MEKKKFRTIRNALTEHAKQEYGGASGIYETENVLNARNYFKERHREDPEMAGKGVELKDAESRAREKLGDPIWALYLDYWQQQWEKTEPARERGEEQIARTASFAGEYSQKVKELYRKALEETTDAVIGELRTTEKGAKAIRSAVAPVNAKMLELFVLDMGSSED